jgi:hypothetical protein
MEVLKIRGVRIFLGEACGRRAGGLGVGGRLTTLEKIVMYRQ